MIGLWLPGRFWMDHADRCGVDAALERHSGQSVYVELTDEQLDNLKSDAAHYANDMSGEDWGRDEYGKAIIASAKRTVAAIARSTNPTGD